MKEQTGGAGSSSFNLTTLIDNSQDAAGFFRLLGNETRLKILCYLADQEKTVSEIKDFTALQQPTVSQQLALLRADGLVDTRREGKTIFYSLRHPHMRAILECADTFFEAGAE